MINKFIGKIGENIRRYRVLSEIEVDELSVLTGISESDLSLFEKGEVDIDLFSLYNISKAINVDIVEFFKDIGD